MKSFTQNLKYDFPSGLVVFLVAVPLCLGIALASGAPLFSGIIAGIVGGIVVTAFSDSQLGVSGPAAGLVVIVLTSIQTLGTFEAFLAAVALAGLLQIALGYLKAGIIGYYFPTSVIKGMLSAIGILIIIKQIPLALGFDSHAFFAETGADHFMLDIKTATSHVSRASSILALCSLGILILWEKVIIKQGKVFQFIQGPLVVVIFGIIFTVYIDPVSVLNLSDHHMVSLPVAQRGSDILAFFTHPDFSALTNPQLYIVAVTIAIVASIETLLCVEATDKMDPQKRVTDTNQELKAQGIGNLVSGLVGGLPVTQVIVRSSANIQSGGKTKASAMIHGILILLAAFLAPSLLNKIPLACLASILIMVGYKLAKPTVIKDVYKLGPHQFIPFIVTIVAIVATDLLKGIGIGMATAIFFILKENYKKPFFFHSERHIEGEKIRIELSEHVSFLNKASFLLTLDHIPPNSVVEIDGSNSHYIDYDVKEIIKDFSKTAAQKNITLNLIGVGI